MNSKTPEALNGYIDYLDSLNPDTKPEWGIMTAQHMVEHLIFTMKLSNGKWKGDLAFDERKLPALKRFLFSDKPMPQNFTNPLIGEGLKPLVFSGLDEAKEALKNEIEDFYTYFNDYPDARPVNPTFGELSFEEWIQFHHKHFMHHLNQFGCV